MASQSINFRPAAVIKQIPWSLDKKAALGLLLILVTFSLVGWLYLGQASIITSSTLQIEKLQQEIKLVNQQNAELALEIAELESLSRIEERARELGFAPTDPANIRYLPIANYPTPSPQAALPDLAQHPQPEDETWQIWLDSLMAWIAGKPTTKR
jgi:cell division protein FtsL